MSWLVLAIVGTVVSVCVVQLHIFVHSEQSSLMYQFSL